MKSILIQNHSALAISYKRRPDKVVFQKTQVTADGWQMSNILTNNCVPPIKSAHYPLNLTKVSLHDRYYGAFPKAGLDWITGSERRA